MCMYSFGDADVALRAAPLGKGFSKVHIIPEGSLGSRWPGYCTGQFFFSATIAEKRHIRGRLFVVGARYDHRQQ